MDGREAMATGPSSFYIHRGFGGPGSGSQAGLHGQPGTRPIPNPSLSLPMQSSHIGGGSGSMSSFQLESRSSVSPQSGGPSGMGQGQPVKRKRGRPRKYGPDGTAALALSPLSSSTPGSVPVTGVLSVSGSGSAAPTQKRGRGRPPGTGRKQQLASLGEWIAGSAGMGFTPHIITIAVGEDIAAKIMSFSQRGPRAVCILSANGAVSTVTLRQAGNSGGTVTYEGRFEILCLSGSYMLAESGGSQDRSGGLSISLASPDGRVIGGGVGGMLRAATPVQVVVGSFIYGGLKRKNKAKTEPDPAQEADLLIGDKQSTSPGTTMPNQNLAPSPLMVGWPVSRQMDMRNAHIDIDLTRG